MAVLIKCVTQQKYSSNKKRNNKYRKLDRRHLE